MKRRIQLIGLCRFSYPTAQDGFARIPDTLEAQRAMLYHPARLAVRMFFLEHVMLPALRAQSDPDFTLILLMGDQLPEPMRARIDRLIEGLPQIRPVIHPEGQPHRAIARKVFHAARDPQSYCVGEFILDDDDAVAVDFIERSRAVFTKSRGLWREANRLVLDFNRGFLLDVQSGAPVFRPLSAPYWTPASCMFLRPGTERSIQDFRHTKVWRHLPTVTMPREAMFIRGVHGDNDSSVGRRPAGAHWHEMGAEEILAQLRRRFALDPDTIARSWREIAPLRR